jgi:hypothetical protein
MTFSCKNWAVISWTIVLSFLYFNIVKGTQIYEDIFVLKTA